ncbi:MAG: hypothetical protein JRI68_06125 [Deltaproteobacteria bacterium]|nr:hypothetical protein [Deltaproteobacteria bacterium]
MAHVASCRNGARQASSIAVGDERNGRGAALLVGLVTAALLAGGCSSSGARGEAPVAALGTLDSEPEFRPLMRRWVLGSADQRQALDDDLAGFARRHPKGQLARMALVLRAWNALERDELDEAPSLAQEGLLGPPGVSHDLATLVVGAAERRQGKHLEALRRLRPLLHKLLDAYATALLNEELVEAAIGARRWDDAVRFMGVWQREAEPGSRRAVAARIEALLGDVPAKELYAALHQKAAKQEVESGMEMARLVAQQLAVKVVAARDATFARLLLEEHGALLGRYGEAVARLAADTTRGRVKARTVGVLLALETAALRRRSADVVAGMTFGLGLPGSQARLVTRPGGKTDAEARLALAELAAEGAAVIVAGIGPARSGAVVRYARDNSLPVVLLTPDAAGTHQAEPVVFLAGVDPADTVGVLSASLRKGGAKVVAGLGSALREGQGEDGRLGIGLEHPCSPLPNAAELRAEQVGALVVYDGAFCNREVWELAEALRVPVGIGLGAPALGKVPGSVRRLAVGVFPVDPERLDPRLSGWIGSRRGVPSWWAALGRDAAVLAWSAVQDLEEAATEDLEVRARRVEATSALATARAPLWTSASRGFGSDRRIPRSVELLRGARRGQP